MSLPETYSELLRKKFDSRIDYDEGNELHPRLAAQLVKSGQLREGWKVLDLACGTGFVTFLAAAAVGSRGSVTGVDFSSVLLRQVRCDLSDRNCQRPFHVELHHEVMDD